MINLDFSTPNLELAKQVYAIADECDSSFPHIPIKTNIDFDLANLFREIIVKYLKEQSIEIDNDTLEFYVEELISKQETHEQEEKNKKEAIHNAILERINRDSNTGWKLAYDLCNGINGIEACILRYNLYRHLPDISIFSKIEIYQEYINSIEHSNDYTNLDKMRSYLALAELYLQLIKTDPNQNTQYNIDKMFLCLENAFNFSDDISTKVDTLKRIINICKTNAFEKKLIEWKNNYIKLCLSLNNPQYYDEYLIDLTLSSNCSNGVVLDIISKADEKNYSERTFYTLLKLKKFDEAERILMVLDIAYKNSNPLSTSHSAWIESQKYRMKYYRDGFIFPTLWTSIHFYDNIRVCDISDATELHQLLKKYRKYFSKHRQYLTDIQLHEYGSSERFEETQMLWLKACEQEIKIIPKIISFIDAFRDYVHKNALTSNQLFNIDTILSDDKYKLANCSIFLNLAKYYTKIGMLDDALRVCNSAIDCGFINDGTKTGMIGRKTRLERKLKQ